MNPLFIYAIMAIIFIIWLIIASKNKSKWGVNFKRVYCPICRTRQPIIRMPDSVAQASWGGTTCPKCHTKLDKYGNIIS
jgi:RNase P subunit RPR2